MAGAAIGLFDLLWMSFLHVDTWSLVAGLLEREVGFL